MIGLDLRVELEGPDLLLELEGIAGAIGPELRDLNEQIGEAVEKASKGPTPERTGDLQRSIFPDFEPNGEMSVGPHLDYGEFVHRRVPFMLIAYQIAEPTIDRLLDQAGDHIVEAR